tara:strand:+ start:599 stop:1633 length:1035 start_codon:yes stop_codon:yes gene_type:complete
MVTTTKKLTKADLEYKAKGDKMLRDNARQQWDDLPTNDKKLSGKIHSRSNQLKALASSWDIVISELLTNPEHWLASGTDKRIKEILDSIQSTKSEFLAEHVDGENIYGIRQDRNIDNAGRVSVYFSDKDLLDIYNADSHDLKVTLFIIKAVIKITAVTIQTIGLTNDYFMSGKQARPKADFIKLIESSYGFMSNKDKGIRYQDAKFLGKLHGEYTDYYKKLINNKAIDIDGILEIIPDIDAKNEQVKAKAKATEQAKAKTGASAKAESIAVSSLKSMTDDAHRDFSKQLLKTHRQFICKRCYKKTEKVAFLPKDMPTACMNIIKVGAGKNRASEKCLTLLTPLQ